MARANAPGPGGSLMRVLIDTTYAQRAPYSGTGIYVERLISGLGELGVEVVAAANTNRRAPAGGGVGSLRNLASDAKWTTVELPRRAREAGAQLIHHPLPAHAPVAPVPQVITVADLAFARLPKAFDRGFRAYAKVIHRAAALAASAVITISETTADDVVELWRVPRERIVVAHHGPGQSLEQLPRPAEPDYFLYVGDDEPRKNLVGLIDAYDAYRNLVSGPLDLVLAGSARAEGPGIRIETHPDPRKLAALYAGAAALVHPSLYEGFGMTPLEAMRLGTPVIAADSPGVSEVCGDAVRYANFANPGTVGKVLAELAADPAERDRLQGLGAARAEEFTWRKCARAHLDAYSLAVGA
jgi:glycosyltransferase involved in cell wall biosynthesis